MDYYKDNTKEDLRSTHFSESNDLEIINIVNYTNQSISSQSDNIVSYEEGKKHQINNHHFSKKQINLRQSISQDQINSQQKQYMQLFPGEYSLKWNRSITIKQISDLTGQNDFTKIDQKNTKQRHATKQNNSQNEQLQVCQQNNSLIGQKQILSDKLSFIMDLQSKLQNLQHKMQLKPSLTQFSLQKYQQNLDQQYLRYQQKLVKDASQQQQTINKLSKFSHCFQQDQELIKTFEQFSITHSNQTIKTVKMLNTDSKIKNMIYQKNQNECEDFNRKDSQYNLTASDQICTFLHINQQSNKMLLNLNNSSFLSNNQESNASIHKNYKQMQQQGSLFFPENYSKNLKNSNDQINIISKVLSTNSQYDEIFKKASCLQIQNIELKEKVSKQNNQIQTLALSNQKIWNQKQELQKMYQQVESSRYRLNQHIGIMREQFIQQINTNKKKLKEHYEQLVENLQNQQSEYAQRIIQFEQIFQENNINEEKLNEQIKSKNKQIQVLSQEVNSREIQILQIYNSKKYLQQLFKKKQQSLINDLQQTEKANADLQKLIETYQQKFDQNGFYSLEQEAQQLKLTLEKNEINHNEQLEVLQNRYQNLIDQYQNELQMMKSQLKKVKLNKTNSNFKKSLCDSYQSLADIKEKQVSDINLKARKNIRFKGSNIIGYTSIIKSVKNSQNQEAYSSSLNIGQPQSFKNNYQSYQYQHIQQSETSKEINRGCTSEILKNSSISNQNGYFIREQLASLYTKYEDLQNLLIRQRAQKANLSKKIQQIQHTLQTYVRELQSKQKENQQNEQVFKQCVEELQNQHNLNEKLKKKINDILSLQSDSNANISSNQGPSQQFSKLKIHNSKLKKYIKVLEKQISSFTLLDDNCKLKAYQETIQQLKDLVASKLFQCN